MKHIKHMLAFVCIVFSFQALGDERTPVVSLVNAIAHPENIDQRRISISGVLGVGPEGELAIYLDGGSKDKLVTANAVLLWINDQDEARYREQLGMYVLATGLFDKQNPRGQYAGGLRHVERVRSYPLIKDL